MSIRAVAVVAGGAAAVAVLAAGCGGSAPAGGTVSATPPAVSTTAATGSTSTGDAPVGAPDPNAPEVNAAGDIPDNQVFVPFTPAGAAFSVSVPEGWAQSGQGTSTVFTDKYNSVQIDTLPRAAAPNVGSVRTQDVPQLQRSVPGFALGDVRAVQRSAGPAVLLTYGATSAPNAVTGKSVTQAVERYAFWRDGQQVVLTLSGPTGADNVDPWRTITDSLRWRP
jgi:hypothetical protein